MALGLNKGEHIAIWAANLPEWLLLYMAAAKTGLVLVTVNPVFVRKKWSTSSSRAMLAPFLHGQVRDHDCLEPCAP